MTKATSMECYDTLIIGHISKDIIITPADEQSCVGGAVVYAAIAAHCSEANVAALTMLKAQDLSLLDIFKKHGIPVYHRISQRTTSIRNTYFTADRERRKCELISFADPFGAEDIPKGVRADLFYLGGLIRGEFPEGFLTHLAKLGRIAVDAQGFLRVNEGGELIFKDWPRKKELLPLIHFFKVDAAEAEILTKSSDHEEAARILCSWGAKEVVLTHSAGVTVCFGERICFYPFTSKNLSGRTGRGDTCFGTYCTFRKDRSPEESCLFAAALTSLKMETPGPFSGSREVVEKAIAARYR